MTGNATLNTQLANTVAFEGVATNLQRRRVDSQAATTTVCQTTSD